jgi:hypothetical protein
MQRFAFINIEISREARVYFHSRHIERIMIIIKLETVVRVI